MKSLSRWLYTISSGKVALAALLVFVLFMVFVLPGQAAKAEETAAGAGSPDTTFLYGTDELYQMAEAYGPEGRAAYIRARFTFDLIFPVVYGLFLLTSVSWAGTHALEAGSVWRLLNGIPLLAVVFDLLENIGASMVMARYPARTPIVDILTPLCSVLKWGFISIAFALLPAFLSLALWKASRSDHP